jgi:hypothetical protein
MIFCLNELHARLKLHGISNQNTYTRVFLEKLGVAKLVKNFMEPEGTFSSAF